MDKILHCFKFIVHIWGAIMFKTLQRMYKDVLLSSCSRISYIGKKCNTVLSEDGKNSNGVQ